MFLQIKITTASIKNLLKS